MWLPIQNLVSFSTHFNMLLLSNLLKFLNTELSRLINTPSGDATVVIVEGCYFNLPYKMSVFRTSTTMFFAQNLLVCWSWMMIYCLPGFKKPAYTNIEPLRSSIAIIICSSDIFLVFFILSSTFGGKLTNIISSALYGKFSNNLSLQSLLYS